MNSPGVYTTVDELLSLRHLAQGLALTARKQSQALADGNVKTRYRGRGMEFAEVRPYQPGDDIRTIDWRVTARVQSPYTKLFQEEHERPVFIMVDQRSPMFFGSQTVFKSVYAAQLAACCGWIALSNNDRVGALVFGDQNKKDIRPRRGKHAVLDLTHQLVQFNQTLTTPAPTPNSTSLKQMLEETTRVAKPGSKVVLISDFADFNDACKEPLALLARRSDVISLHVHDPLESSLPNSGFLALSDSEQRITVNAKKVYQAFADAFTAHTARLKKAMISTGVQYANAPNSVTIEHFVKDLFDRKKGAANLRRAV